MLVIELTRQPLLLLVSSGYDLAVFHAHLVLLLPLQHLLLEFLSYLVVVIR